MKCEANFFYNENVGSCFPCSGVCDDLKATGNSYEYCKKVCPDYIPTLPGKTNSGSHHLEIILPVIVLFLSISIVVIGIIIRKHRRRNRQNVQQVVHPPARPLIMTTEEVGDGEGEGEVDDSGIDTTSIDIKNESIEQDGSQLIDSIPPETRSLHQETQIGLSEMLCDSRFLRNASDASGAQAV